jgi:hypothetical protein
MIVKEELKILKISLNFILNQSKIKIINSKIQASRKSNFLLKYKKIKE